jgi:hypothetical protein
MVNMKILFSEDNMDLIKCEPDPCEESYLTCSCNDSQQTDIAQSEGSVLMGVSIMKTENEVICVSVSLSHVKHVTDYLLLNPNECCSLSAQHIFRKNKAACFG